MTRLGIDTGSAESKYTITSFISPFMIDTCFICCFVAFQMVLSNYYINYFNCQGANANIAEPGSKITTHTPYTHDGDQNMVDTTGTKICRLCPRLHP